MHHPLIGAFFPFIIALCLYFRRGARGSLRLLILTPAAMAACALWAVIPDIPRLIGAQQFYLKLTRSQLSNIFFLHYTIDQIEHLYFEPIAPLFNVLFVIMVFLLLTAAWNELCQAEQNGD